ncbi:MAG TPA: urease accessory UreF family protein [Roseiflexaceae bacterium]|nr:urease accessory UreF family protein [Roseiflexaceae bacterium]
MNVRRHNPSFHTSMLARRQNSKLKTQNSKLLPALQLADSFFPSGMFTQSHGLESFAEQLRNADDVAALLHSYLLHIAATGDALAARWAARALADSDLDLVAAIDARLEATKLAQEGRRASRLCGRRVLLLGAELLDRPALREYAARVEAGHAPGHQAVALALWAAASGLDEEAAVLVELHTFTVSLVSAALRMGLIDHVAGQRLLLQAQPIMREAAAAGRAMDWRDIGGFAPEIELMQFRHAYAEMHMFVS